MTREGKVHPTGRKFIVSYRNDSSESMAVKGVNDEKNNSKHKPERKNTCFIIPQ